VTGVRGRTLAVLAALVVAAGCGGGSSDEPESGSGGAQGGKAIVVTTRDMPGYGTVLANQSGRPLYVLSADPKGGTKCTGSCAKDWPPLTGGKPSADGKVEESLLGTFKRPDGAQQVLYNGHALYTNTGEELAGIGTKALGGTWYLVSAKGEPVKTTQTGGY
jgi:predicted lipoprotein with Yx(FWY)xxD motif